MKQLLIACVALTVGTISAATTWTVDKETGDDAAAAADKTGATPFLHLQAAVSNAKAGDTVEVGPGVYGTSEGEPLTDDENGRARLCIPLAITVKSTAGAGSTVIEGVFDETDSKLGPNAVRCVTIKTAGTVLEGFTLRNGATAADDNDKKGRGGAVYTLGSAANRLGIYVVDCVISNCVSYNSAVFFGTLYRTKVVDCSSPSLYAAQVSGRAWFSHFAANRSPNGTMAGCTAVNCTFTGNQTYDAFANSTYPTSLTNCVCAMSSGLSAANGYLFVDATVTPRSDDPNALIAPLFGDFRVRTAGPADGTGLAAALDAIELPAGYELTDIEKNPVDVAHLQLGAYQTKQAAAAGGVSFAANMEVDGRVGAYASAVFPLAYPVQYRVRGVPTSDLPVFGYKTSFGSPWRFPGLTNDYIAVMPSPVVGTIVTNTFETAGVTLWVDKAGGNDTSGTGTELNPYASIQKAVSESSSSYYTIIRVKKGAYDNGVCDYIYNTKAAAQTGYGKSRVNLWSKKVRIVATDGPDETSIVGETNDADGGRCLMMQGNVGTCVQGFTLTGGHTAKTTTSSGHGGGYYGINANCYLYDCVVTGNAGVQSAAGTGAFAVRCRFSDNSLVEVSGAAPCIVGGNSETVLDGCVLDNACASGGALGRNVTAVNCTVFGDSVTDCLLVNDATLRSVCTVFDGSKRAQPKPTQEECLFWNMAVVDPSVTGYVTGNPSFIDPQSGDFRVLANSPVFAAAAVPTAANYGTNYYQYAVTDANGALRPFASGRPAVGACAERVPGVVIAADRGGLSVSGGQLGVNAVEGEATIAISGSGTAERPCAGVTVNGAPYLFDDLPDGRLTINAAMAADGLDVAALYTSDWYVNCDTSVGSDEHSGFTPKNALRTAGEAFSRAVAGDTVHLADGTYDASSAPAMSFAVTYSGTSYTTYARLAIPVGITVTGTSREGTVIVGAAATPGSVGYDQATGCGADAVRGVALLGSGSAIANATIRNGRTPIFGDTNDKKKNNAANFGGGAWCGSDATGGLVSNCVVEACAAYRGGGFVYVRGVNCLVRGNTAVDAAAASYYGAYDGCAFTDNSSSIYIVEYPRALRNCTIARNQTTGSGAAHVYITALNNFELVNTLVAGPSYSKYAGNISHCAFASDFKSPYVITNALTDGTCVYAPLAQLATDADGRPTVGANAAIAQGDETRYDAALCGAADPTGVQRVMNGKMDIGALEADYRPLYKRAIGLKRGAVTDVTRNVMLTNDGKISLSDGDMLSANWNHKASGTCAVLVTVPDGGVMTVKLNGEVLETVVGPAEAQEVVFTGAAAASDRLVVSYAGTRTATFTVQDPKRGLMLMVR